MSHTAPSARLATTALVVGLALLGWPGVTSADYKMIQNTSTGRLTSGAQVECNAPAGFAHWNTRDVSWRHNTANQGAGKKTALENAMASWTNVTNATYQLNYDGTTSAGFGTDGINTVLWGNTGSLPDCGSCLALTALVLQSGQVIVESDVIFTNELTWTTNGSDYDTESVAAHELGHTLGIHHPSMAGGPETMSNPYFGIGMRSLHPNDHAALQCSENRYPAVCSGNPPPRPLTLSVINQYCWGYNLVSWSASTCPVTRYEVWGSTSMSFTNPFLIYSGSATSTTMQVTQSQIQVYVWVRACYNSLCGHYRGLGIAQYYAGCCVTPPC